MDPDRIAAVEAAMAAAAAKKRNQPPDLYPRDPGEPLTEAEAAAARRVAAEAVAAGLDPVDAVFDMG